MQPTRTNDRRAVNGLAALLALEVTLPALFWAAGGDPWQIGNVAFFVIAIGFPSLMLMGARHARR